MQVQEKQDFNFGQNHKYIAVLNRSVKVLERLRALRDTEQRLDFVNRDLAQARLLQELLELLNVVERKRAACWGVHVRGTRVVRRVGGVARRRGGRVAAEAERVLDVLDRRVLEARRLEELLKRREVSAEVAE
jgi:hypothetical protein